MPKGAGGRRDGERRDRDAGLREAQLGVRGEVADHRDDGVIRHGCSSAPGVLWVVRGSVRDDGSRGVEAHELGAHDGLVESELAIELLRGGSLRGELQDDVDALGLLVDLVVLLNQYLFYNLFLP